MSEYHHVVFDLSKPRRLELFGCLLMYTSARIIYFKARIATLPGGVGYQLFDPVANKEERGLRSGLASGISLSL